jgi:hypothetical protein
VPEKIREKKCQKKMKKKNKMARKKDSCGFGEQASQDDGTCVGRGAGGGVGEFRGVGSAGSHYFLLFFFLLLLLPFWGLRERHVGNRRPGINQSEAACKHRPAGFRRRGEKFKDDGWRETMGRKKITARLR